MDKPRANTAVAHKLARMVYFMPTRGEAFVDQRRRNIGAPSKAAPLHWALSCAFKALAYTGF